MQPMVSIIVPIYNAEQYLRRCVDSILNQEYTDYELLLVNDGSTDASGDICEEYGDQDPRVIVIQRRTPESLTAETGRLTVPGENICSSSTVTTGSHRMPPDCSCGQRRSTAVTWSFLTFTAWWESVCPPRETSKRRACSPEKSSQHI